MASHWVGFTFPWNRITSIKLTRLYGKNNSQRADRIEVKKKGFADKWIHGNWEENPTGIILLPGSFSGRMSSPRPHRGPLNKKNAETIRIMLNHTHTHTHTKESKLQTNLPSKRMSFATFIRDVATVFRAPLVSTKASCAAWLKRNKYSWMCNYFAWQLRRYKLMINSFNLKQNGKINKQKLDQRELRDSPKLQTYFLLWQMASLSHLLQQQQFSHQT